MPTSSILQPFQLLEINIISAQDLARVCRNMRTYAVAWVHPDRKLSTRVETLGHTNPTWNDKFVFRVDEEFMNGDTSAIMIEIYALHWFKDIHVGTVRAMVSNVAPPRTKWNQPGTRHVGMRFVALQVRRPSGRPQGILNIGVTVLDSSMRSMPLYTQLGSAIGYRDLMGESSVNTKTDQNVNNNSLAKPISIVQLRRTQSDTSSMVSSSIMSRRRNMQGNEKSGSVVGGSEVGVRGKMVKSSSMIAGSEINKSRGGSMISVTMRRKKGSSIINGSEVLDPPTKLKRGGGGAASSIVLAKRYMTESELGPSPSEVAANLAHRRVAEGSGSEILGTWNLDTSVEGLDAKLERWRAELPPVYDNGGEFSWRSYETSSTEGHERRRSDGGLFSCFGTICGVECSIVCGGADAKSRSGRNRGGSDRHNRSFSDEQSFI